MNVIEIASFPGWRDCTDSRESPQSSESSSRRTNQRTTPERSMIARPVSPSIHQSMSLRTNESGSGLQVARILGLTPHVVRIRLVRYQNCDDVKCVSSSKPMNAYCFPWCE